MYIYTLFQEGDIYLARWPVFHMTLGTNGDKYVFFYYLIFYFYWPKMISLNIFYFYLVRYTYKYIQNIKGFKRKLEAYVIELEFLSHTMTSLKIFVTSYLK